MKHLSKTFLIFLLLSLSAGSCKEDDGSEVAADPEPPFQIQFYVVDLEGNLRFPVEGETNSIYTPQDFNASSQFTENIGQYNSHDEYGHIFRIKESWSIINTNETLWLNDSIIKFFFCFGSSCDTIRAFNPGHISSCSAETILWGNDAIQDYNCNLLQYVTEQ